MGEDFDVEARTALTVWQLPDDGSDENPYGRLLAESLERSGLRVVRIPHRHLFSLSAATARPQVAHFQSIAPFVLPARPSTARVRTLAKAPFFLLQTALLRAMGCRIVWSVHNLGNHDGRLRRLERRFSRLFTRMTDTIVVHGEAARAGVVRELRIDPARTSVRVLYHPSYAEAYPNEISRDEARRRLGISPSTRVLLSFGQIRGYKGLPDLVDAFAAERRDAAELWIVGEVVDRGVGRELERFAREVEGVRYRRGRVPEEAVQLYLNACDVVVFSYREILTSGGVALAMSFGRACAAPRLAGIVDALDDEGAFLHPPGDAGLRAMIRDSLRAPDSDLERMGQYNSDQARSRTWDRVATELLAIYRTEVSRTPSRAAAVDRAT